MRVLGIDPGLTTTGYAVVERDGGSLTPVTHGVIRTDKGLPVERRLADLRVQLLAVIDEARPGRCSVERVFFSANRKTAIAVGQASGVILACAAEREVPVTHHTPTEVKRAVSGNGAADKSQVGAMVARLLGMESPPRPADAADACALAICGLTASGLDDAIRRALA